MENCIFEHARQKIIRVIFEDWQLAFPMLQQTEIVPYISEIERIKRIERIFVDASKAIGSTGVSLQDLNRNKPGLPIFKGPPPPPPPPRRQK